MSSIPPIEEGTAPTSTSATGEKIEVSREEDSEVMVISQDATTAAGAHSTSHQTQRRPPVAGVTTRSSTRAEEDATQDTTTPATTFDLDIDLNTQIYYKGEMPRPVGTIASFCAKAQVAEQHSIATSFYIACTNPSPTMFATTNDRKKILCGLLHVPGSTKVRVVYGCCFTSLPYPAIEEPITSKFLVFTGEGGDRLGLPNAMLLPASIITPIEMKVPSHEQYRLGIVRNPTWFGGFKVNKLDTNALTPVPKIAAIPAYIVYDGFEGDLDVDDVYERLMLFGPDSKEAWLQNCLTFLRAGRVTRNKNDPKPFLATEDFARVLCTPGKFWANYHYYSLFPQKLLNPDEEEHLNQHQDQQSLVEDHPAENNDDDEQHDGDEEDSVEVLFNNNEEDNAATPPITRRAPTTPTLPTPELVAPSTTPTATPTNQLQTTFLELLKSLAQTSSPQTTAVGGGTKEEHNMSATEISITRSLCGITSSDEHLPAWFQAVSEKGQNDNVRNQIIIEQLQYKVYDDVEVTIHAPLLQMIKKRLWLPNDFALNVRNAGKGLSVFSCHPMSEDEVATLNETMDALSNATTTTAQDYKEVTVIKPVVPDNYQEFVDLIKIFANLLFALFGGKCQHLIHIKALISYMNTFSRPAKAAMTQHTRASILWIITLQTRLFASGSNKVKAEFKTMMRKLAAKDLSITHAETPEALVNPGTSNKRKADEQLQKPHTAQSLPPQMQPQYPPSQPQPFGTWNGGYQAPYAPPLPPPPPPNGSYYQSLPLFHNDHSQYYMQAPPTQEPPKNPGRRNDRVHPKIYKEFVQKVLQANPRSTLTNICKACNTTVANLLNNKLDKCANFKVGMCKNRECSRIHEYPSDKEAEHILTLLAPAIKNPNIAKSG